jgi:hypothetical protein
LIDFLFDTCTSGSLSSEDSFFFFCFFLLFTSSSESLLTFFLLMDAPFFTLVYFHSY